jgi:hypothetical protein
MIGWLWTSDGWNAVKFHLISRRLSWDAGDRQLGDEFRVDQLQVI